MKNSIPSFCRDLLTRPVFESSVVIVILVAGILVGLETSRALMERYGDWIRLADRLILGLFTIEIIIRFLATGPSPRIYFRNGWNWFDLTVVVVALLPFGGPWVTVARLARILRVVRLVRGVPRLQVLIKAVLKSLPSMGYVCVLLGLHFYIYAVSGVFFFRDNDPDHFGTLGDALITLFRIATLEDWTDIMYTAIHGSDLRPAEGALQIAADPRGFGLWAVIYFVSFVIIGAMVIINLLVGVMVSSLSEAQAETLRDNLGVNEVRDREAQVLAAVQSVDEQMSELKRLVQR